MSCRSFSQTVIRRVFRGRTEKGAHRQSSQSLRVSHLSLLFLLLLPLAPAFAAAQQAARDLDGKPVHPITSNAGKPVVLVFVRKDCPISGRYAPTIQRVSREHQNDVRFYLVFPDKSELPKGIRKYLHDYGYSIAALRDPEHVLVRQAYARITPEAAVFDARGSLVYHGRIDNLYASIGRARAAPTTRELEDAIQAALAGRPLSNREVAGVGCDISDLQ
jgi:thiol-disulfide isomerase/thioredoxin